MLRFGLVALLVVAATCASTPAVAERADPPGGLTYVRSVLTDDGSEVRYRQGAGGRVSMTGFSTARQRDWNRREVFRLPSAPKTNRQTTCATWLRQSRPSAQQGLAVRIRDSAGRVRAVTLTKNVEFGLFWVFNLLTWDTERAGDPWRPVGRFDMSPIIGRSAVRLTPLPWRVCLRATGRTVAFKVWLPRERSEPAWSDRHYVRTARLPQGYAVGRPGWYVGHLPDGGRLVYGGLTTR